LFVDHYGRNRVTGSFVMVDLVSNATVAGGMITGRNPRVPGSIQEHDTGAAELARISDAERQARMGHPALLIWINGGAELAYAVERELFRRGFVTHVIVAQTDGRVLLELAQNLLASGLVTICSAELVYEVQRERAGSLIEPNQFIDFDASRFDDPGRVTVLIT
jgi:hypothetical protein